MQNSTDKSKRAAYMKQYRLTEKNKMYRNRYMITTDKETRNEYHRCYYTHNKKKIFKQQQPYIKQYHKRRLQVDLLYRIKCKLRSAVYHAFKRIGKNKPARTEQLLGCTWIEAKAHFERLFQEGMSWDNHGEWHIDHIRPVAAFKPDELHLINHISNLQPLWAEENLGSKKVSDNTKWIQFQNHL